MTLDLDPCSQRLLFLPLPGICAVLTAPQPELGQGHRLDTEGGAAETLCTEHRAEPCRGPPQTIRLWWGQRPTHSVAPDKSHVSFLASYTCHLPIQSGRLFLPTVPPLWARRWEGGQFANQEFISLLFAVTCREICYTSEKPT